MKANRPRRGCQLQAYALAIGFAASLPALGSGLPLLRNSAVNDSAVTTVGTSITIAVLDNDQVGHGSTMLRVTRPPRSGTARVVDGEVLYTPDPGFEGSDSFRYISIGLGAIGKGRVDVDVGVPFAISGTVTDAPVANAVVTATIGGRSYTTTADGLGNYTLNLIGTGRDMVVLGARGPAAQAAVNFLSMVGQFDRLREEAGGDGMLDRDENNQVQVTHLSTAEAFLLQAANGGQPVTSDSDLDEARAALAMDSLLQMAAAIKLVVDEGFPLPAGADDVLDMISDQALLDQFVADAEAAAPGALDAATQATLADPAVTPPATADDYVGNHTLLYQIGATGTIRVGIGQGERLELAADGTGRYLWYAPNANPSVTWTFAGNVVDVAFDDPASATFHPYVPGIGQVREVLTQTGLSITRLVDGGGRDIFGVTLAYNYSYPDHPEWGVYEYVDSYSSLAYLDGAAGIPFNPAEFPALRTLPIALASAESQPGTGYRMLDFAGDGTGQRDDGLAFLWGIDEEGRLLVDYGDGNGSTYSRIARDGRGGDGVMAEHQWDGHGSSEWSISNEFDGSLVFSAELLSNSWRTGFDLSDPSLDPPLVGPYWVLEPDGTAVVTHQNLSTGTIHAEEYSWRLDGATGGMEASRYADDTGQVPACTPPENGCHIWKQRRWHPVSMDGNRIYLIEEVLQDIDGDQDLELQAKRGNFYDAEEIPWIP